MLKTLSSEHPSVANLYDNIELTYCFKGDYDRAIEYRQKALEIRLKKLGPGTPDVADSYNNLGVAYKSKRDYD